MRFGWRTSSKGLNYKRNKKTAQVILWQQIIHLISNKNRSSKKSKHINIKFLVVEERVQCGHISIEHLRTNSMITDSMTKGIPPKVFHEYTTHMCVIQLEGSLVYWELVTIVSYVLCLIVYIHTHIFVLRSDKK